MTNKTGGPAFPAIIPFYHSDVQGKDYPDYSEAGMTLRDYMATKFAAAWVVALSARQGGPGWGDVAAAIEANRLGLEQADDMLRERKK